MKFKIIVEYDHGMDLQLDRRIADAVGYSFEDGGPVLSCDSGCLLVEPYTRDQVFYLDDEAAVFVAEQALQRIGGLRVCVEREGKAIDR